MFKPTLLLPALAATLLLSTPYVAALEDAGAPSDSPMPTYPPSTPPSPTMIPPTTPPPTMTPAPPCDVIPNKDIFGFDLTSLQRPLWQCPSECANMAGCITYTYSNGRCWLKSHTGKLIDKPGVSATSCTFNNQQLVCNPFSSVDIVGNDIANKPGKSVDDCCDVCNEFSGCKAYSWSDYNGGTCWLKNGSIPAITKPGVTSGSVVSLFGGMCLFEYDTDYVDNDIANVAGATASDCCWKCKNYAGCNAYSWNSYNGGTCWLKSGKGTAVPAKGVISAYRVGY